MLKFIFYFLLLLCSISNLATAQRFYSYYQPGDWVSYTNSRFVTSIARGFNTVYFGTTGGILRYDIISEKWLEPLTTSDGMPENRIVRLGVDRLTDEIWIETANYISYFNPTFEEWENTSEFPFDKLQPDGITIKELPQLFTDFEYNYLSSGIIQDRHFHDYQITELLLDDMMDISWLGIWGLGAAVADLSTFDLTIKPTGPYYNDIACLAVDIDDVWLLGSANYYQGMITHYDRQEDVWEYYDPLDYHEIKSDEFNVVKTDQKNIWIGTGQGLLKFNKEESSFHSYRNFDGIYGEEVFSILPIRGNIIIGTEMGVSVFDLKRDTIYSATDDNIRGQLIWDLEYGNRVIYAATDNGIYTLKWGEGHWERLLLDAPYLRSPVYDIQVVDSLLYTCGDDGVVIVNLNDLSYQLHDRNLAFRGADLQTLLVHDNIMFAGGYNGLFRYNPQFRSWYHYTESDGLISDRVTSLAADGDYIWIGSSGGGTRFFWNNRDRRDWLE